MNVKKNRDFVTPCTLLNTIEVQSHAFNVLTSPLAKYQNPIPRILASLNSPLWKVRYFFKKFEIFRKIRIFTKIYFGRRNPKRKQWFGSGRRCFVNKIFRIFYSGEFCILLHLAPSLRNYLCCCCCDQFPPFSNFANLKIFIPWQHLPKKCCLCSHNKVMVPIQFYLFGKQQFLHFRNRFTRNEKRSWRIANLENGKMYENGHKSQQVWKESRLLLQRAHSFNFIFGWLVVSDKQQQLLRNS